MSGGLCDGLQAEQNQLLSLESSNNLDESLRVARRTPVDGDEAAGGVRLALARKQIKKKSHENHSKIVQK